MKWRLGGRPVATAEFDGADSRHRIFGALSSDTRSLRRVGPYFTGMPRIWISGHPSRFSVGSGNAQFGTGCTKCCRTDFATRDYSSMPALFDMDGASVRHVSRAREVPVDPASGLPPSRPLRSEMFPDGLPDLYPTSAVRIRSANELYAFTAILIEAAQDISLLWVVEQPLRSMAWHTSWLAPHVRNGVMNETRFCADRQLPALVRRITPISRGKEPRVSVRLRKPRTPRPFANALQPFALPRQKLEASNQSRPA